MRTIDAQEKSLEELIVIKEKLSDALFKEVFKTHDRNIANILKQRTAVDRQSIDSLDVIITATTKKQRSLSPNSTTYDELMNAD